MIDLHSHILPGIDDGPATLAQSVELAKMMVADGIEVVAGTPHGRGDYPRTTADRVERAVLELDDALEQAGVPLTVVSGAELAIDRLPELAPDELRRLSLGGNGHYVLVETPYGGWPVELLECLYALRRSELVPILAHPERNPEVQQRPALLEALVAGGVLVQLTAASVDGRLGASSKSTAAELLRRGLAHLLASDAHLPQIRAAGMSAARSAVGSPALGEWLTQSVPEAILAGAPPPPRPR